MKINFSSPSLPRTGPLVVSVLSGGKLLATAERVDRATGGALTRAINASRFRGESGQWLTVMAPSGVRASRVILIGLGEAERIDELAAQTFGGRAWKAVAGTGDKLAMIAVDPIKGSKLKTWEFRQRGLRRAARLLHVRQVPHPGKGRCKTQRDCADVRVPRFGRCQKIFRSEGEGGGRGFHDPRSCVGTCQRDLPGDVGSAGAVAVQACR